MQDLIIAEGQLIHQRAELERQQDRLCTILNASPIEFESSLCSIGSVRCTEQDCVDISLSLTQINDKLHDHLQMLTNLKVRSLSSATIQCCSIVIIRIVVTVRYQRVTSKFKHMLDV
jgi:hypothetical protein